MKSFLEVGFPALLWSTLNRWTVSYIAFVPLLLFPMRSSYRVTENEAQRRCKRKVSNKNNSLWKWLHSNTNKNNEQNENEEI